MATQGERIEALEQENGQMQAELGRAMEKIADLERVLKDGEPITAELVEGYSPRNDLLKAFRQIESIANHINVKLPS